MAVNPDISNLNQDTKKIVANILKACESEARGYRIQIPPEDFEDRVAFYTGIPKSTIHQIMKKDSSAIYPKPSSIDLINHLLILKTLGKFYERKEVPSFKLLLTRVNQFLSTMNDQSRFLDADNFKQNMTMLGIDYFTISNDTKLLMEDPKITFQRYSYLKKIKKIRQQKDTVIYYIGERIIDQYRNFRNPWNKVEHKADISSGDCVLFYAVSKNGFTNGLYCFSATEDDFYRWVVDILLGCLLPSSVVVLDNSPLHGTSKSKTISMFDTKSVMKKWLRNHNVPFSDAMNKSELYQLIINHANIEEIPRVDHVIKAHGHQVLRLPTHFEDLSPLDHIWQDIKRQLQDEKDLHDKILSIFKNTPKETYELYEADIVKGENAMFLIDTETDNALEKILQDLKNTSGGHPMYILNPVEDVQINDVQIVS